MANFGCRYDIEFQKIKFWMEEQLNLLFMHVLLIEYCHFMTLKGYIH